MNSSKTVIATAGGSPGGGSPVTSVAGRTGVVVLAAADISDSTSLGRSLITAANAAAGRTALGLVIGTDVQAQDAELSAIAGLTSAADKLPYFTGSGTAALADLTAAARTVLDDATVAAMVDTLGGAAATGTGGLVRKDSPTFTTAMTAAAPTFTGVIKGAVGSSILSYNLDTDASNYERGYVRWTSNELRIGTEKLGTGATRAMQIVVNAASGFYWDGTTGYLGSSGGINFSGSVFTAADSRASYFGVGGNAYITGPASGVILLQNFGLTDFNRLCFGLSTSAAPALKRSGANLQARLADDSAFTFVEDLYRRSGSGSPESAVTAPVGAIYHRTDGGASTSLYVKESGAGNTGWVAK